VRSALLNDEGTDILGEIDLAENTTIVIYNGGLYYRSGRWWDKALFVRGRVEQVDSLNES
jgi:hypothetical protein